MSLDLDWSLLDGALAHQLLDKLNRSLSKAHRPDFIGPISLTSLEFGEDIPDVRITGVGDVWREFVEAGKTPTATADQGNSAATANRARSGKTAKTSGATDGQDVFDVDELEADRHRSKPRAKQTIGGDGRHDPSLHLTRLAEQSLPFTGPGVIGPRLQTFRQYTPSDTQQVHGGGSVASFAASIPHWASGGGGGSGSVSGSGLTTPAWGGAGLGARALVPGGSNHSASGYFSPWHAPTPPTPYSSHYSKPTHWRRSPSFTSGPTGQTSARGRPATFASGGGVDVGEEPAFVGDVSGSSSGLPSLQMQLSVVWSTNTIKLAINTSLLVNHPTPSFLELPLNVSVIGLGVQTGVVVAFEEGEESDGRKVHISLVEDPELEDDAVQLTNDVAVHHGSGQTSGARGAGDGSLGSERDAHLLGSSNAASATRSPNQYHAPSAGAPGVSTISAPLHPPQRPLTVGERLLPHITLESSVGQTDKHVLRNVGKVEKFLIELIRKAVEDEVSPATAALPCRVQKGSCN